MAVSTRKNKNLAHMWPEKLRIFFFSRHLNLFYKGFEFNSLWNVDGTFADFQRRASEAAEGTGQLHGVLELTIQGCAGD